MKQGNWIPLDKRLVALLPKDRPYTILEAMVSYSVDRDNDKQGSISGYANLWGWSRVKVRRFIKTLESGQDYQGDSYETGKGHPVRLIFNNLESIKDRQKTGKRQYYNPDPKPKNIIPEFEIFWNLYPPRNGRKVGKKACADHFRFISNGDGELLVQAVKNYAASKEARDGFARDPIRFLKKDYWRDWLPQNQPEEKPFENC